MSSRFPHNFRLSMIIGTIALIATACGASGTTPVSNNADQSQGQAQGSDAAEFGLTEAEVVRRSHRAQQKLRRQQYRSRTCAGQPRGLRG